MQPKIKYKTTTTTTGKNHRITHTDKSKNKNFLDDNDVSIYKTKRTISTSLFTASTRPQHIQRMYEQAAPTPVLPILCNGGDTSSEDSFSVCPLSFGHTRRQITRKIDADIETRVVSSRETFYLIFLCIFFTKPWECVYASECLFLLLLFILVYFCLLAWVFPTQMLI